MNSTDGPSRSEPWHARSTDEVRRAFNVDLTHGLPAVEASRRLAESGPNAITEEKKEQWWQEALESLTEPLQLLLIAVAGVYFWLGETGDAITILAVILIVAGIEVFSELRAKHAIASLASLASPHAVVLRSGQPAEIPTRELVTGDIVLLEPGVRVPADMRLLDSVSLRIDESSLTGESAPVVKDARAPVEPAAELASRLTMAYAGTLISAGKGRGVATASASPSYPSRCCSAGAGAARSDIRRVVKRCPSEIRSNSIAIASTESCSCAILGASSAPLDCINWPFRSMRRANARAIGPRMKIAANIPKNATLMTTAPVGTSLRLPRPGKSGGATVPA